jgi:transposase
VGKPRIQGEDIIEPIAIGIDVSKNILDIFCSATKRHWSISNDLVDASKLARDIMNLGAQWVVFEPSGGYERNLMSALIAEGVQFSRVNARQIRDYARACGRLAKTDKLDAQLLADYGLRMHPRITKVTTQAQQTLQDYGLRRRQLVEMLKYEKQRSIQYADKNLTKQVIKHISLLEKSIKEIEHKMFTFIKADSLLKDVFQCLSAVKGVGPVTTLTLISDLPELGYINAQQIAALVGVAPQNHDSGNMRGQRHIQGGRKAVRNVLYMASLASIRHDPDMNAFYKKLREKGKPPKVAIVACMRKLTIWLNAKLKDFYVLKNITVN